MSIAQAQDTALPLWEVGLAGGAITTPAYPGSIDRTSRTLALPFLIYRGDMLRLDRSGLEARLVHTPDIEFDVGLAASLPSNSSDVAARQGMPDLHTLLELGPRLKWTLLRPGPQSQLHLVLPLRSVLEVNGGLHARGLSFEPELLFETRDRAQGWRSWASAGLVLGDQRLNDYFYGVRPEYAMPLRVAYEAHAGLIATRLALGASTQLGKDIRASGFVRLDNYATAANRASPLHLQNSGTSLGVALTWTLARSQARARD